MADCGLPLLATQAGSVKFAGTQALAGNYVVLRESDTNTDYAYMHLRDAALVERGAQVTTGQLLGYVGDTGNAAAGNYHLHFSISVIADPKRYWEGTNINPYPLLRK